MLNDNILNSILKLLTIIGIVSSISLFYFLFFVGVNYSQYDSPPYEMVAVVNSLTYLLQLFMAYGLWSLYLFLKNDDGERLKTFGIILISYALLKVINGTVSSVLLSWHLGENNRVISVGADEKTLMLIGFGFLVIYLSNLLKSSKQ